MSLDTILSSTRSSNWYFREFSDREEGDSRFDIAVDMGFRIVYDRVGDCCEVPRPAGCLQIFLSGGLRC